MWPERKTPRLREYDYRQSGIYAVTICVCERRPVFGKIESGLMRLHPFGQIARQCWLSIPQHRPNIILDEFVIMPNHIHGIIFIENEAPPDRDEEAQLRHVGKPQSGSLSAIIGCFKASVTRRITEARQCPTRVWQGRFWDHIIRDERDLQSQRDYIFNNPTNWEKDELHL